MFIPGNHELWVKKKSNLDSIQKFNQVLELSEALEIITKPFHYKEITIIPLFSWYDFSFAEINKTLKISWADFYNCIWPVYMSIRQVNNFF